MRGVIHGTEFLRVLLCCIGACCSIVPLGLGTRPVIIR